MPVDEIIKSGKIQKHHIGYVLRLLERDMHSLYGSYIHREHFKHQQQRFHLDLNKRMYEHDVLLELYANAGEMAGLFQEVIDDNARDLYEFFYDKTVSSSGYYCFQFPLDYPKFRKKLVPYKNVVAMLKDLNVKALQICEYMNKNVEILHKELGFERNRPLDVQPWKINQGDE